MAYIKSIKIPLLEADITADGFSNPIKRPPGVIRSFMANIVCADSPNFKARLIHSPDGVLYSVLIDFNDGDAIVAEGLESGGAIIHPNEWLRIEIYSWAAGEITADAKATIIDFTVED